MSNGHFDLCKCKTELLILSPTPCQICSSSRGPHQSSYQHKTSSLLMKNFGVTLIPISRNFTFNSSNPSLLDLNSSDIQNVFSSPYSSLIQTITIFPLGSLPGPAKIFCCGESVVSSAHSSQSVSYNGNFVMSLCR